MTWGGFEHSGKGYNTMLPADLAEIMKCPPGRKSPRQRTCQPQPKWNSQWSVGRKGTLGGKKKPKKQFCHHRCHHHCHHQHRQHHHHHHHHCHNHHRSHHHQRSLATIVRGVAKESDTVQQLKATTVRAIIVDNFLAHTQFQTQHNVLHEHYPFNPPNSLTLPVLQ